jgi:CRP-like cAMP-binding protein
MEKNFFDFLSSNDKALLESKARTHQRVFKDGELILEQGGNNASLYIIRSGDVSIVSRVMEHSLEIDQLHTDDLFGDMSFVDTESISTDIVAIGDVSIDVVTDEDIEEIIKDDPMFYGRFYHALARLLSYRLRKKNDQLASAAFSDEA